MERTYSPLAGVGELTRHWPSVGNGATRFWPRHLVALAFILTAAANAAWDEWQFWSVPEARGWVLLAVVVFAGAAALREHLARIPRASAEKLPTVQSGATAALVLIVVMIMLAWSRFSTAGGFLPAACALSVAWFVLDGWWSGWRRPLCLGLAPGGIAAEVAELPGVIWQHVASPTAEHVVQRRPNGIVVDLHQPLSADWVRFLADCSLHQLPTLHAAAVYETLTGRVSLDHLRADLLPGSAAVGDTLWKRALDLALVILSLPIVLPLMLVVALAIKIEEPGASLWFRQERIGWDGRPFRMLKLRSMRGDAPEPPERLLLVNQTQERTTRVGRVIRKYRLDELPQFWHVLRGEMSVIGPRPEQVPLVERYAQEMPLYHYRHRVKPGITGWAQVNQGYATGINETRVKLQYDLYYVQRCSIWLDLSIVIRTLSVICSGFGAR